MDASYIEQNLFCTWVVWNAGDTRPMWVSSHICRRLNNFCEILMEVVTYNEKQTNRAKRHSIFPEKCPLPSVSPVPDKTKACWYSNLRGFRRPSFGDYIYVKFMSLQLVPLILNRFIYITVSSKKTNTFYWKNSMFGTDIPLFNSNTVRQTHN